MSLLTLSAVVLQGTVVVREDPKGYAMTAKNASVTQILDTLGAKASVIFKYREAPPNEPLTMTSKGSLADIIAAVRAKRPFRVQRVKSLSPLVKMFFVFGDSGSPVADGKHRLIETGIDTWQVRARETTFAAVLGDVVKLYDPELTFEFSKGYESLRIDSFDQESDMPAILRKLVALAGGKLTIRDSARERVEDLASDAWPLTFYSQQLPALDAKSLESSSGQSTDSLADLLAGLVGNVAVKLHGRTVFLTGPRQAITKAKAYLATQIDIPRPGVRLDLWTYQLNEIRQRAPELRTRMETVKAGMAVYRGLIRAFLRDFDRFAVSLPLNYGSVCRCSYLSAFMRLLENEGENLAPWTPLVESQVRLLLADRPSPSVRGYRFGEDSMVWQLVSAEIRREEANGKNPQLLSLLRGLKTRIEKPITDLLPKTMALLDTGKRGADLSTTAVLLSTWAEVISDSPPSDSPERLTYSSAVTDSLLQSLSTSLAQDLDDLFTIPLVRWASDVARRGAKNDPGIDISTRARIAVTSGQAALARASFTSTRTFTESPTLEEMLSKAKTLQEDKNLSEMLSMTPLEAISLAGLLSDKKTTTTLAPGLSIAVRPTVMPDSGSARLLVSMASTFTSSTAGSEVAQDVVKSLEVMTDVVRLEAYDLFQLSTVGSQSVALGDYAWRIPVLEGIPLFGQMFRGPRRKEAKVQEAMVIVGASIVPRSVDMLRRFGRGLPALQPCSINCGLIGAPKVPEPRLGDPCPTPRAKQ